MGNDESVRSRIEARLAAPYDKCTADLTTVGNVIYVAAGQEYLWETYFRLMARTPDRALSAEFAARAVDAQRQNDLISCLYDRDETALEKIVASQSAYISRLADFYRAESDDDVKTAFEYILGDHCAHFTRLTRKLWQREGLSPLARTAFKESGGRPVDLQFIDIKDCLKRPYDREKTADATKTRVRLVIAQELAERRAYQELAAVSGDDHLIVLEQEAAVVDNLHIAMVQSLIDPRETILESARLSELSQVVNLERAVTTTPPGAIRDIFAELLNENLRHLAVKTRPVLETATDVAGIVAKISDNSENLISEGDGWRRAAEAA